MVGADAIVSPLALLSRCVHVFEMEGNIFFFLPRFLRYDSVVDIKIFFFFFSSPPLCSGSPGFWGFFFFLGLIFGGPPVSQRVNFCQPLFPFGSVTGSKGGTICYLIVCVENFNFLGR